MGIVNKLQLESASDKKAAWRRYRDLLRSGDESPKSVDELKRLMVALDKTAAETTADHKILTQTAAHRQSMRQARNFFPQIAPASEAIRIHQQETDALVQKRKQEAEQLRSELGTVYEGYNVGADAVAAINTLREQHPDLLADEPAADEAELKS